jgi:hypothetical protein
LGAPHETFVDPYYPVDFHGLRRDRLAAPTSSPSPTSTATVTPNPTPTTTATPTSTETATLMPTETPILPTPSLPDWAMQDLLTGNQQPGCDLPCWQGLQVNESTAEEVQAVLDDVFGFAGMKDFAMNYPETDTDSIWDVEFAYARGHGWVLSKDPTDELLFVAWLDKETKVLKALVFLWWFDTDRPPPVSWPDLFTALGPPSQILISIEGTELLGYVNLNSVIIYDIGIFHGNDWGTTLLVHDSSYVAEVCFDDIPDNSGSLLVMEPFSEDKSELTPLQSRLVGSNFEPGRMVSFEEMFGISVEEAVGRYLSGEQSCFLSIPLGPAD